MLIKDFYQWLACRRFDFRSDGLYGYALTRIVYCPFYIIGVFQERGLWFLYETVDCRPSVLQAGSESEIIGALQLRLSRYELQSDF